MCFFLQNRLLYSHFIKEVIKKNTLERQPYVFSVPVNFTNGLTKDLVRTSKALAMNLIWEGLV